MTSLVRATVVCLILLTSPAWALPACQDVDKTLSATRKEAFANLVAKSLTKTVDSKQVVIDRFMKSGPWILVWAEPPNLELGVFFFHESARGTVFDEVWGGWALPSEKPELIRWAHARGTSFPDSLARCFADAVTEGH